MSAARERLIQLVDLAGRNTPEDRRRLVSELCALLLDWPGDYPLAMRAPFEQLLEKAAQNVDGGTRATLAGRFAAQPDAPVDLLNELFFDAPDAVKSAIFRRNALANDDAPLPEGDHAAHEAALVAAARGHRGETLASEFARLLGVECKLARRILSEPSGGALAAACKSAHLKRATFSALALLFAPNEDAEKERRLIAYDSVPQGAAENLVRFWRTHPHVGESETEAA